MAGGQVRVLSLVLKVIGSIGSTVIPLSKALNDYYFGVFVYESMCLSLLKSEDNSFSSRLNNSFLEAVVLPKNHSSLKKRCRTVLCQNN